MLNGENEQEDRMKFSDVEDENDEKLLIIIK